jgi:Flp pilus assembly protein TadG
MYVAFTLPVLIGLSGLATEGSLLFYNKRTLQSAADAAAYSASYSIDSNKTNAEAQSESDGYELWLYPRHGLGH